MASPIYAVTVKISTLAIPRTSQSTLKANRKAPLVTVATKSIAANKPLKVRVSLSMVSSDITNLLVNFSKAATELYKSSADLGVKISLHALPNALSGLSTACNKLLSPLRNNSFPLGFSRLDINSFKGVPAFSASSASFLIADTSSSVYPIFISCASVKSSSETV